MTNRSKIISAAAGAAAMAIFSTVVHATDYTWVPTAGGAYDWTLPANWSPNSAFPNANTDTANLSVAMTGNQTIGLAGTAATVGVLTIGSTGSAVTTDITNGTLSINNSTGTASFASVGVAGAINRISANVDLAVGTTEYAASSTRDFQITGTVTASGANRVLNNLSTSLLTLGGPIALSETGAVAGRILQVNAGAATHGNVVISGNISDGGFALSQLQLGPNTTTSAPPYSTITVSGNNTNTGTVSVFRTNLILASNTALGTGTVLFGGSTGAITTQVNSDNDARTIANQVRFNQFITFRGNNSMTFTGQFYETASRGFGNFVAAGKSLNLNNVYSANSADARVMSIDGPGLTVITGSLNDSLGFVNAGSYEKRGTGTLTVNATSSSYSGSTRVRGGLMQFATAAGYGNTTGMTVEAGGAIGLMTGSTNAAFLAKLATGGGAGPTQNPTASAGALALAPADAAVNIDFTSGALANANTQGMGIGAVSSGVTYTATITPAASTYKLGGGGTLTLPNANQLTGANGVTADNGGVVAITGSNDYTGVTRIGGNYINPTQKLFETNIGTSLLISPQSLRVNSVIEANTLAPAGSNSSLGKAAAAAGNLVFNGGTLRYTGTGSTTDRLFTIQPNGATLDASGTGAVVFNNAGAIDVADAGSRSGTIDTNGRTLYLTDVSDLTPGMTVSGSGVTDPSTTIAALMPPSFGNQGSTGNNGPYQIILSVAGTAGAAGPLTFGAQNRTLNLTGTNGGNNSVAGVLGNSATGVLGVAKTGAGKWILGGNNTYTGGTSVTGGTLSLGTAGTAGTGSVNVAAGAALAYEPGRAQAVKPTNVNLAAGAFLDLYDNDMIVDSAWLTKSQVETLVKTARNAGAWNMPGITSTTARNVSTTGLGVISGAEYNTVGGAGNFNGQPYVAADTLVKYTWNGDANFDGRVTFDDYVKIDTGFNTGLTGWLNGDFNYSGAVTFDDYVLIDIAFNQQNGTLGRAIGWVSGDDRSESGRTATGVQEVIGHLEQFGGAYGAAFLAAVPEPTTLALLVVPAVAGMVRRRRRAN